MTPTELRNFCRNLTLVKDHELSDSAIDVFLAEGHTKLTHRRNWEWLLQPVETFTVPAMPFILDNLNQTPIQAIAELALVAEPFHPIAQTTRSEHSFLRRARGTARYPRAYWVENGELWLDPAPDPDQEFQILYYAVEPWDMVADLDVPQVPLEYHSLTVGNYTVHRIWEHQEDLDRSDAYLGRYEMSVNELVEWENRFDSDGPKIFGQPSVAGGRNNMPWLDGV